MRGDAGGEGEVPWCSASDLAEYAFCPRAFYFRHHPPDAGIAAGSQRSRDAGHRYHVQRAVGVRNREDRGGAWAAAAVVAVLLLAVAIYLGWAG